MQAEIAILGAGPAGSAAAVVLAAQHRVALIDRTAAPQPRIGEALIPAARPLLRDLGVLAVMEASGRHLPYLGNRSIWGGGCIEERDFLRDPHGPGWHLDRAAFERMLRRHAVERGAQVLAPARLGMIRPARQGWRLSLGQGETLEARFVIDAGGRRAPVARRLGARPGKGPDLVSTWWAGSVRRETPETAGFSMIEGLPEGWAYTAPLPGRRRLLAWHHLPEPGTSAPLPARIARIGSAEGIAAVLARTGFTPDGAARTTAAHAQWLSAPCGPGWLAVGDAALCPDPMASRGLFNALYTGLTGALTASAWLSGDIRALDDYSSDLARIRETYRQHAARVYAAEQRWPEAPFWARHSLAEAARP
ncbi:MAG: tryptophan 7-halogenase [Pseudomonadota bacterium]